MGEVNDPPFLFQSGGKLARVNLVKVRDKTTAGGEAKTQPLIEPLKKDALRGIVSERLCWVAYTRPIKNQPAMPFKGESPANASYLPWSENDAHSDAGVGTILARPRRAAVTLL